MAELRLELHDDGIQELLKCDGVQSCLEEQARGIARRYNKDAQVDVHIGRTRANASVSVRLDKTMNNELLKAIR